MIDKIKITEEEGIHKEWYIEAKSQTLESLQPFINHLINDYNHDYGTICHAMTACSIATIWATNKTEQGGITGFQAGAVMWEFIRNWNHSDNKIGMALLNYDDLLYPQYAYKFDKTMSNNIWERLQEEVKEKLKKDKEQVHPKVLAHWKSISEGVIPFGFKLNEEYD